MHKKLLLKYIGLEKNDNKNERLWPGKLNDDRFGNGKKK